MDFALLFVALLTAYLAYLQVKKHKVKTEIVQKERPIVPEPGKPLLLKLLSFIWNYPVAGEGQSSWAIKESAILRGDLKSARENPGLGVAIFSIDLALNVFGENAMSRIKVCIDWGLQRVQDTPPYFMIVEIIDPITSRIKRIPDFRHTLALGIILAKARPNSKYLEYYIQSTLESQKEDGGWAPGHGKTVSEVFTVLYAVEFLTLCHRNRNLSRKTQKDLVIARDKAVNWLINNTAKNGLWKSGVLKYTWDPLLTTAWVLRRLVSLKEINTKSWIDCVKRALHTMVVESHDFNTGGSYDATQWFRVETRICSAVTVTNRELCLDGILKEKVAAYLTESSQRIKEKLSCILDEEIDLSTALFAIDSITTPSELKKCALQISTMEREEPSSSSSLTASKT